MARRPAPLDASDPRLPLGVFQLCGCGERVIPAWETTCPACRGAPERAAAPAAAPPPPPPWPAPAPVPTTSGVTPRPTALHVLPPAPPAPPPRSAPAEASPRRTVKLDLASMRGTPVAPAPAPPPPAPAGSPKRTVMLSLPTPPTPGAELVLAWSAPADEGHEGWTLQGAAPDGTPVTLHLRWHGERWHLLDATGAPIEETDLAALGLGLRGGRP